MSNEMQIFNPAADMETSGQAAFMSFTCTTQEEKIKAYNAMNTTDTRLKECINMEIPLVDVMIVPTQVTNRETGEVENIEPVKVSTVISKETSEKVLSMMESVVSERNRKKCKSRRL